MVRVRGGPVVLERFSPTLRPVLSTLGTLGVFGQSSNWAETIVEITVPLTTAADGRDAIAPCVYPETRLMWPGTVGPNTVE